MKTKKPLDENAEHNKNIIRSSQVDNINSIEEILNYEKNRYVKKGYGLISAILICFSWFFIVPQTAKFWWPKEIKNEGKFYAVSVYANHEFWFIFCNIIMWIIYKLESPFFERYKVHDKEWPWKRNLSEWQKTIKETILYLFVNHMFFLPLMLLPSYIKNESFARVDFESLPGHLEVIAHTVFFMIVEDTSFYWGHRFLHMDFIYPYIHKIHHKYVNTVSISSEFAHPIEFMFTNLLTTGLGMVLLGKRTHLFTYLMWVVLRIAETTDGHCGYEFSWSPFRLLPMSAGSEYHNYHHLAFKGNYGSFFTVWDRVCNTVHHRYLEFIEKKKEIYKKIEIEESKNKKIEEEKKSQ